MNSDVANLIDTPFSDNYSPLHQNGPDYVIPTEELRTWHADGSVRINVPKNLEEEWKPVSVVTALKKTVNEYPNHVALVVKRNNSLVRWTWTDYWNDIKNAAKGFIKLGLLPFHGVAILGFNAPEWVISFWGAIFSGGFGVGIYTTNSPEACFHILNDCSANIIVVENNRQLQKILQIRDSLPHLKTIIQYTEEPLQPGVLSWQNLLAIGRSVSDDVLTRRVRGLAINQCCCIVYTSGTTGNSKGVMISHDCFMSMTQTLCKKIWLHTKGKDTQLSYLPLSHVASLMSDIIVPTYIVSCVHFASPDVLKGKLAENLIAARPSIMFGVPRVFEKVYEAIAEAELGMTATKRNIFKWARKQALNYHMKPNGSSPPFLYRLAKNLVLSKVKRSIGLENARTIGVGGAPMSEEVEKFFLSLDLFLRQGFGLSECTAVHLGNYTGSFKTGSCGRQESMPNYESKIHEPDEHGVGEILLRGRNIFLGYLNQEDKTLETIDDEGWLHTGDTGKFDNDGFLFITGRIKELVITSGGENIPPLIIENAVKRLIPAVSNCMVIGDRRKYLTIIITLKCLIDMDTMLPLDQLAPPCITWCRSVGSNAQTVSEIIKTKDDAVFKAIQVAIDEYNSKEAISHAQRLQKWRIIPQDFSIPNGELTPTVKMKRPFITTKYSTLIEQMYSEI